LKALGSLKVETGMEAAVVPQKRSTLDFAALGFPVGWYALGTAQVQNEEASMINTL